MVSNGYASMANNRLKSVGSDIYIYHVCYSLFLHYVKKTNAENIIPN